MKQVKWKWADRGETLREGTAANGELARCLVASRLGSIELSTHDLSFWVQVRGHAWVEAKEGRFYLRPGDWIALSRDSHPVVQADPAGLTLGLCVADATMRAMSRFADFCLHAGRGHVGKVSLRAFVNLWHRLARSIEGAGPTARLEAPLRTALLHLADMQSELAPRLEHCPGPSLGRKRQVFDRMQRARLYMEGHCDRIVSISELAERTQFSVWYFSKVFHRLYGESPQSASSALRLEHAANLLVTTSMTIGEVSSASGFENNCSFARSFRARFGMTASDYRGERRPGLVTQTCGASRANYIAGDRAPLGYDRKNVVSRSRHNVAGRLTRP